MSEKLLVSIIIPVYNVEKYLLACVNSVINQTYKCLEIILVDDGSTDSSGRICDECAKLDSRIKVIHKTNGGLSDARNAGIDAATGDYLAFVDSDDIIHTRFVEMLYALANYLNADVSSVEFKNFYDEETLDLEEILVGKTMILQSEEAIDKILYQNILDNSACNKLYDRRLFDGLRFPIGKLYEDLAIFYKVYERAKKVVHRREAYYFYRLRRDSITGNFSLRRTDVLDITDEIVAYMKTCNLALLPAALDRKFAANMNILWLMTRSGQCDVAVEQRCWGNIKELRRMILCNPKSRLKNRLGALVAMLGLRGLKFIFKLKKHSR